MRYRYTARTSAGEIKTGIIEAKNNDQAISALQGAGLIIVSLKAKAKEPFFSREVRIFQGVRQKDLVIFSRQLSILFSAKVSLVESLKITAKQTENKYFRDIILKIADDVEAGLVLSKALDKYAKIFSPFYINMVKSGEISGNLENVLNYLADYMEKQYYLNSKVKGALVYPALIFTGFIIVAVIMLVTIIPNLTSIIKETGQELPWSTKLIVSVSDGLIKFGWLIFLILIILAVFGWRYLQTSVSARKQLDRFKLKLPVLGEVFQKFYLNRLTDSLGTLIAGGVSILQSLQVASNVIGNEALKEIVLEAQSEVRIGNTMSSVFEKYEEIPVMVTQMLAIGEQTGAIDEVLKKIAAFYSKEVDNTVATLSQLIEPALIIVLGFGIGFLVASILLPIYNIAGTGL